VSALEAGVGWCRLQQTHEPSAQWLCPNHTRPAAFMIDSSMMQLVLKCDEAGLRPS
jgi:hypothetical protein